jgi:c(7)-type cytochrome triheme protein
LGTLFFANSALAFDRGNQVTQLAFLRPASNTAAQELPQESATENTPPLARQAIDQSTLIDPNNPDRDKLQTISEATKGMPYDANGFPDWMKALNLGLIKPRAGLKPDQKMEILDLDIIMRNTKEMPFIRFPHKSHTLWLSCSNCHPFPFKAQAGSTQIRMADIFRGEYCGMCHDRIAFITFFSCQRCHSVPQDTAIPSVKSRENR